MITISKPKLLGLILIILTASTAFYFGHVLAIPAPSINSVCEPGACTSQDCSYYVYRNQILANDITTLIKNFTTGANDFLGSSADVALQSLFNFLATVPQPTPIPPGGTNQGATFVIVFGVGVFYINAPVTINLPGIANNANALTFRGQSQDKTVLVLRNQVNDDMFKIVNVGAKFEFDMMKLVGGSTQQNCGLPAWGLHFSGASTEIKVFNTEIGYFCTGAILLDGQGLDFNDFEGVWFPGEPRGIDFGPNGSGYKDVRIIGCKFGPSMNQGGIRFDIVVDRVNIVGNNFDSAGISDFSAGVTDVSIVSNNFYASRDQELYFQGTGLAALKRLNVTIVGNLIQTTTSTNRAIYLANRVDGIIVTANSFNGFTSSSTVPITLIQTTQKLTTLITQNSGMGSSWTGFGIAQPAVGASTVNVQNTNPYQVRVYITGVGSGITAYKITDALGTSNTFTTTVAVGYTIEVDPYAQVALTYTGVPTWVWYSQANLA